MATYYVHGMQMEVLAVALLTLMTSCVTGQIWAPRNTTSHWDFKTVHTAVNTSIVSSTVLCDSPASCAHHCASMLPMGTTTPVSLYFITEARQCSCNSGFDHDMEDGRQPEVIYGTLKTSIKIDTTTNQHTRTTLWPYIQDCHGIDEYYANLATTRRAVNKTMGVYVLHPDNDGDPIDVWCDGSGIVIQRRLEGGENFYRNWSDYVSGFGDTTGEYWLGLRDQHRLTRRSVRMQIELDRNNELRHPSVCPVLLYDNVSIGNEESKYLFQHVRFTPRMVFVNDIFNDLVQLWFSTFDNDNDFSDDENLAQATQSGWWIGRVAESNPNSPYTDHGGEDGALPGRLLNLLTPYMADIMWHVNRTTIKLFPTEVPFKFYA